MDTKCIVQMFGEVTDVFTELTPGHYVFVGVNGDLAQSPVSPFPGVGVFHQSAGIAFASDVVFLYLDPITMVKTIG